MTQDIWNSEAMKKVLEFQKEYIEPDLKHNNDHYTEYERLSQEEKLLYSLGEVGDTHQATLKILPILKQNPKLVESLDKAGDAYRKKYENKQHSPIIKRMIKGIGNFFYLRKKSFLSQALEQMKSADKAIKEIEQERKQKDIDIIKGNLTKIGKDSIDPGEVYALVTKKLDPKKAVELMKKLQTPPKSYKGELNLQEMGKENIDAALVGTTVAATTQAHVANKTTQHNVHSSFPKQQKQHSSQGL